MQQSKNPQPDDVGQNHTKSKRDRPYNIEVRYRFWGQTKWVKWHRHKSYRTEAERDQALDNLQRKYGRFAEYRPC